MKIIFKDRIVPEIEDGKDSYTLFTYFLNEHSFATDWFVTRQGDYRIKYFDNFNIIEKVIVVKAYLLMVRFENLKIARMEITND